MRRNGDISQMTMRLANRFAGTGVAARRRRLAAACFFLLVAIALHALLRWPEDRGRALPEIVHRLASVSYNPPSISPTQAQAIEDVAAARARIERDLAVIAKQARNVRIYSVYGQLGDVPELARKVGLTVSLGIDVDMRDRQATRLELERGIALAQRWPNVTQIYVGNETLLRKEATPAQLRGLMREVRRRTGKPVSTGETWDTWMRYPELAEDADFVAAHILPFWEGVDANQAVSSALQHYQTLRAEFPMLPICIAEFGWPSGRFNHYAAIPSGYNQAAVLRRFVSAAARLGLDYNIIEAMDQPWKTMEGNVGQFWGIFDADGTPKFSWHGTTHASHGSGLRLCLGVVLGVAVYGLLLRLDRATLPQLPLVALGSQALGYIVAEVVVAPLDYYLTIAQVLAWLITIPLVLLLAITSADKLRELSQMMLGAGPRRLLRGRASDEVEARGALPFVSIHVPICNERPEVVEQTLRSLARLDYAAFEVLAIVNNYRSAALLDEVARICRQLGPRFVLLDLPRVAGFKAGALNQALAHSDERASVIAVVDADYVVAPTWLRQTVPAFSAPQIALVQSPQDHRDAADHRLGAAINSEYGAFFDVGMIQRNEHDAIIVHGTMLLVRRIALEQAGGWDEHCICEDTELGLRLLLAGWHSVYTPTRYGAGLLPDDFRAYRTQRQRWAYGAIRILRKHGRALISPRASLSLGQRYHFLLGWAHWLGDGIGVLLAVFNIAWTVVMLAGDYGDPPPLAASYVLLVALTIALVHGLLTQLWRPGTSVRAALYSVCCAASLQLSIARGVLLACCGRPYPFIVTAKGRARSVALRQRGLEVLPDLALALALLVSSALLLASNRFDVSAINVFALVLLVQALPYVAAVTVGLCMFNAGQRSWRRWLSEEGRR